MSNSNRFESEFVQIENNDEWKQTFMVNKNFILEKK
jgi:hypothetical protein